MEEGFWLSFDLISRVLVNQPIVSICLASINHVILICGP